MFWRSTLKHGVLSKYTLLPWEDSAEYESIVNALVVEHKPETVTEEHLVEELAGIMWRKRRLRMAEASYIHTKIEDGFDSFHNKIVSSALINVKLESSAHNFEPKETLINSAEQIKEVQEETKQCLIMVDEVINMIDKKCGYNKAVAALSEDIKDWWEGELEESTGCIEYKKTSDSLREFLDYKVRSDCKNKLEQVRYNDKIKNHLLGRSYQPDAKIQEFVRYEVHLDRKMERVLTVLIRLQEIRKGKQVNLL